MLNWHNFLSARFMRADAWRRQQLSPAWIMRLNDVSAVPVTAISPCCSIVLTTSPLYAHQRMEATAERQENAIRSGSPETRRSRPGLIGIAYPIPRPARPILLNATYVFVCAVGVVTTRRSRRRGVSPR